MITYLLKSAACLALLLFFYHLVLEREKMHQFNRIYLLFGVLLSFVIPLATITVQSEPLVFSASEPIVEPVVDIAEFNAPIEEVTINYTALFSYLYVGIALIFLTRFVLNFFKLIRKIRINKNIPYNRAILVLVDDAILPHTFWNYIFINKDDYYDEKIEQELFTHELTHVTQKHTIDVLLIELLQIIFWINPLFIFIKKAIQLNHEYLADDTVITAHKNTFQYQHLLVNKAAWKNDYYLASNLNYSLTKKRLKMMTTKSSPTKILLKKLSVIPLLVGFVFLFAERVEAQEIIEVVEEEKEKPIETIYEQGISTQLKYINNKYYKQYIYNNGKFTFKDKNGKSISKKYTELTEEEKLKLAPPPPLIRKEQIPTQKIINELKDDTKYALWIDGKPVKNEVLNNYKASDFARYANSYIYKNARSKRFPQANQAHLETKKYFKAQNELRVNKYLTYLKEKHNIEEIEEVQEIPEKKEIIEIKEQKKKKYNSPSSNGSKQSVKIPKLTIKDVENFAKSVNDKKVNSGFKNIKGSLFYYVTVNGNTKYYNKNGKLSDKNGNLISNKKANASAIIPDMYVKTVHYKGKVFCTFEDDKQKSKKPQFEGNEELEALIKKESKGYSLEKYLKINELYEYSRQQKPHYIKSDKKRQEKLEEQFSLLGTLYFKLSKENKRKTERPVHPHDPYLKLMKNNKVFYKLRKDLTEEDKRLLPPPPAEANASKLEKEKAKKARKEWQKRTGNSKQNYKSSNNNSLDLIVKMAKQEAEFFFENKPISSDQAIALVKKNKGLNIHSESTDFNMYKVWISKNKINKPNAKNKLSDFQINMNKKANQLILKCNYGCDWKELKFPLKQDKLLAMVNEFGSKKDENNKSTFWFHINYNFGKVELKSNKGAAWKGLGFNLENNKKISQFGVTAK